MWCPIFSLKKQMASGFYGSRTKIKNRINGETAYTGQNQILINKKEEYNGYQR